MIPAWPEALPPPRGRKRWTITADTDGIGRCNNRLRQMSVPAGDTAIERMVRVHEQIHAAISPLRVPRIPGVDPRTLQVLEDCRVWDRAFIAVPDAMTTATGNSSYLERSINEGPKDWYRLAQQVISWSRTRDGDPLIAALERNTAPEAGIVLIAVHSIPLHLSSWNRVTEASRDVQPILDTLRPKGAADPGKPEVNTREGASWGDMETAYPALTERIRPHSSRTPQGREEGSVPRYWSRLLIDGRVFARRIPVRGGTVLVDVSGSMIWSTADLRRAIELAPGATIATYGAATRSQGTLTIVGRNGRISTETPRGQGAFNVIDGPALRWLGTQAEPRTWISDGYVRGLDEQVSPKHYADVARLCIAHRIRRIESADILHART